MVSYSSFDYKPKCIYCREKKRQKNWLYCSKAFSRDYILLLYIAKCMGKPETRHVGPIVPVKEMLIPQHSRQVGASNIMATIREGSHMVVMARCLLYIVLPYSVYMKVELVWSSTWCKGTSVFYVFSV